MASARLRAPVDAASLAAFRVAFGAVMLVAVARAAGHAAAEVRADVFVTLNGRPSRRFVDPDADLAAATRAPVLPRSRATGAAALARVPLR